MGKENVPRVRRRLVLRRDAWPSRHRALFEEGIFAGTQVGSRLDPKAYAARVQPHTIHNAEKGWGRLLHVLASDGMLDPLSEPASCATPANIRLLLAAMEAEGNLDNTIVTRLYDVRAALQIMHPELEFSWLTHPGGHKLRSLFDVRPRPKEVMDSADLLAWSIDLMEGASRRERATERLSQYRNGLMLMLLTVFAPRLRTLTSLRLERNLIRRGDGYQLIFRAADMKRKNKRSYKLPPDFSPYLDHYLDVVRPRLLGNRPSDWLWVHAKGHRLGERGIEKMIWRGSEHRFGVAFGSHSFRHALATTLDRKFPDRPGIAAIILANSAETVEENYVHGREHDAASTFIQHVRDERRRTAPMAWGGRGVIRGSLRRRKPPSPG